MGKLLSHLSYANVLSTLCLFLLLGGGAYAATRLKENSVGSRQIIDGQVKSVDVQDNGITGTDIKEDSLGQVPRAAQAGSADSATNAGNADQLDNKDSTAFALAGSEGWQPAALYDGSGHLVCYWTNFGGGQSDAAYFRDPAGVVHLRGLVKAHDGSEVPCDVIFGGDPNRIFTLPAGYRPDRQSIAATVSNNSPGRINVNADGRVAIETGYPSFANAKQWVSLDNISVRCAPSGANGCP
jgi:hypothetical protein